MLANYLIGLREGLEAGLIVSILVAYIGKLGRRDLMRNLWIGVGGAIALSLAVGAVLAFGPGGLSEEAQEGLGGILSIVAVAFVTWMVLWMARHARTLRSELQSRVNVALGGSAVALVVLGVVSVGREGVETALFVWSSVTASQQVVAGVTGAVLGILTAVVLSVLLSLGVIRIDLARFFRWTGVLLVIIAAGVLASGVEALQGANLLPGEATRAFDISAVLPPESWWGVLLAGGLGIVAQPTWAQVLVWIAYLAVVGTLFLARQRPSRPAPVEGAAERGISHGPATEPVSPAAPS